MLSSFNLIHTCIILLLQPIMDFAALIDNFVMYWTLILFDWTLILSDFRYFLETSIYLVCHCTDLQNQEKSSMGCIWYIEILRTHLLHVVWNSTAVLSQKFHASVQYRCAPCVLYAFLTTSGIWTGSWIFTKWVLHFARHYELLVRPSML